MTNEQERAAFEAWYRYHHGNRDVYALDDYGEYVDKQVQGAFNVWIARAALQSQDREDALRYRAWRRAIVKDDEAFLKAYVEYKWVLGEFTEELIDASIDHARRIEGGGE